MVSSCPPGTAVSVGGAWLLALSSSFTWAQNPEEQPSWYQVEVVIFERLSGNNGGDSELWPKNIHLSYPRNWQKLLSADQAEGMQEYLAAETPPADSPPEPEALNLSLPGESATGSGDSLLAPEEPVPPVLRAEDHLELAFVRLPVAERTLNESKGAIDRRRNMRVLFHEAWRQPVVAASEAPSIVIQGGNSYGEHTELEGSIRVSISRYLHLHSNLWLSQFIPNYGQEPEHWPPLPAVPEHATPAYTAEELTFSLLDENESLWQLDTAVSDDYSNVIEKPFLIKEIVTLQQTRRMRSGELHYLDHPRLGLLIKVDNYEPEPDQPQD